MFKKQIQSYVPMNEQEVQDQKVILNYIKLFEHNILTRENEFAHLTSSGFILNEARDKVLMIYHNLYNSWAWTGGHADGEADLLAVAIKEAKEETGVANIRPLECRNHVIRYFTGLGSYEEREIREFSSTFKCFLFISCEVRKMYYVLKKMRIVMSVGFQLMKLKHTVRNHK